MDLLFSRYASPYCYLDALLNSGQLVEGIINTWETVQEEKSWNYYLSNNPMNDKSFEDWKEELKRQNPTAMSKAQVVATVNKSQNILKGFKLSK